MKIVINTCYGGFGLSDKAYEWMMEQGVKVQKYYQQVRGEDGKFKDEERNDGEVIFDRDLEEEDESDPQFLGAMRLLAGRYWEKWVTRETRNHAVVVMVVEELGDEANGKHAKLKVVEVPDEVEWEIEEYDGIEWVAEKHRVWS